MELRGSPSLGLKYKKVKVQEKGIKEIIFSYYFKK